MTRRAFWVAGMLAVAACSASTGDTGRGGDGDGDADVGGDGDGDGRDPPEHCDEPEAAADITIDPAYSEAYVAYTLGAVPGMPPNKYGGLHLAADDPDTLLIGGDANLEQAQVYAVKLVRSCGHIVGFAGDAEPRASAPYVDGSVELSPHGVLLFTGYPVNTLGQIAPGGSEPARTTDLSALGIEASVGSLGFVPAGFEGEGALEMISWPSGALYAMEFTTDADGLLEITAATLQATLEGGPEGFAYVPPGSPLFDGPRVIVSEWSANTVATYAIAPGGAPDLPTRKQLLQGLAGAEGAFFDPATGDFLFSTWNGDGGNEQVLLVRGFAPIF